MKFREKYELYNGNVRINGSLNSSRLIILWFHSPRNRVKINVDAPLNENKVNFGVVIKDDAEIVLISNLKRVKDNWSLTLVGSSWCN